MFRSCDFFSCRWIELTLPLPWSGHAMTRKTANPKLLTSKTSINLEIIFLLAWNHCAGSMSMIPENDPNQMFQICFYLWKGINFWDFRFNNYSRLINPVLKVAIDDTPSVSVTYLTLVMLYTSFFSKHYCTQSSHLYCSNCLNPQPKYKVCIYIFFSYVHIVPRIR